jgi:hypothetical protein
MLHTRERFPSCETEEDLLAELLLSFQGLDQVYVTNEILMRLLTCEHNIQHRWIHLKDDMRGHLLYSEISPHTLPIAEPQNMVGGGEAFSEDLQNLS